MAEHIMERLGMCSPEKVKLHAAMFILQFSYAGFHIVFRAILNMGVSKVVFLAYRNIIALCLLGPYAYFFEKQARITANQGFYMLRLYNASPTVALAIQNFVPTITFVMAAALSNLHSLLAEEDPSYCRFLLRTTS